jgi:hypothetical protein
MKESGSDCQSERYRVRWEQALRLRGSAEAIFPVLCTTVSVLSGLMLFFLIFARKEIFGAVDPALFVTPFISFTLTMPCAVLSLVFAAFYAHARSAQLISWIESNQPEQQEYSRTRFWLYPAVAFGTIAVILFLAGAASITYLILL